MHIHAFDWDEKNESHIVRHGVALLEVEEAIFFDKPFYQRSREDKYVAYAVTEEGRFLFIVLAIKGPDRIRIITARDMTDKEKRYYGKRRGVR